MIDIHHHCIPGVDDGPRDLAQASDLCRAALDDGITTIIATPHVLRGEWQNASRERLDEGLSRLRDVVGDKPQLVLGSEYFFDFDMVEVLAGGRGIVPLADSHYILVELDAHNVPPMIDSPFYRAQLEGWTPVIAHPERNSVFQSKPELLALLVRRGAKTQITAASLLGDFGPEPQHASIRWIKQGLVHFMATDAHNVKRRPPRLSAARAAVRELAGEDVAEALVSGNPASVLGHRQLAWEPDPESVEESRGLLASL